MKNILVIILAIVVIVLLRRKKATAATGTEKPGAIVDDGNGTITVTFENADGTTTTKVIPEGMNIATKPPQPETSFSNANAFTTDPKVIGTQPAVKPAAAPVSSKFTPRFNSIESSFI